MQWPAQFRVMRLSPGRFCLEVSSFPIPRQSKNEHVCWRRPGLFTLAVQRTTCLEQRGAVVKEDLASDHASIDWDGRTCHVRRIFRSNKGNDVSDLLRSCKTLEGHCRNERRFILICAGEAGEHTGVRCARGDYVDPNSAPGDFQCGGFCQSLYSMFAGHI